MKQRIKRSDSVKLDADLVRGFLDEFLFVQRNEPDQIHEFWEQHSNKLLDFWLNGTSLNIDEYLIKNFKADIFSRPELWYIFEATQPKLHYMLTPNEPRNTNPRLAGYIAGQGCQTEDEGLYLIRCGLLSAKEIEYTKLIEYSPDPDYWEKDSYKIEEVSPFLTPHNNQWCGHWKCHLDRLDWRQRFALEFGNARYDDIDPKEYKRVNEGNPYL